MNTGLWRSGSAPALQEKLLEKVLSKPKKRKVAGSNPAKSIKLLFKKLSANYNTFK